jgi:hypothetical protein
MCAVTNLPVGCSRYVEGPNAKIAVSALGIKRLDVDTNRDAFINIHILVNVRYAGELYMEGYDFPGGD